MQDEKLLKKLHTDPEHGMRTLINLYAGLVYAVVRSKLRSPDFGETDVESCAADTFSEFYCDLDKYDPSQGSIRSWLCVIARNNALDHLRRHYRDSGLVSLDDGSLPQQADDFSLEGDFEDRAMRAALIQAIRELGQPDRQILMRKYYLGQTSKQIADTLHMSVSNVDTRTHRAIQKLRKQFGGDCE